MANSVTSKRRLYVWVAPTVYDTLYDMAAARQESGESEVTPSSLTEDALKHALKRLKRKHGAPSPRPAGTKARAGRPPRRTSDTTAPSEAEAEVAVRAK